uniref:Sialate O-acetylesterase-like n=1 Tax=Phallusia mammillata TaxID=59560 RepID=A0A6F9DSW0_9ASCI|nr:sialate O-acetylesterase-like [Phallusia mammillata]
MERSSKNSLARLCRSSNTSLCCSGTVLSVIATRAKQISELLQELLCKSKFVAIVSQFTFASILESKNFIMQLLVLYVSLILHIAAFCSGDDFAFASYFQNNMVLQREPQRAVIWGYGTVGASVMVSLDSDIYMTTVTTGPNGKGMWVVKLEPQPVGGPRVLSAVQNADEIFNAVILENILFGDVWVCSGQSNMQFTMSQVFNASAELELTSNYPDIRIFTVAETESETSMYDLMSIEENWSIPSKETVGGPVWKYFSAVCWLFGRHLYDEIQIPIGLVASTWGGTPVESWSSNRALQKCGLNAYDTEYEKLMEYLKQKEHQMLKENKKFKINPNENSVLWNAMIHPLLNMTIKGAIWYQGEQNAIYHPDKYACSFPAMITDWRRSWYESHQETDSEFPFGFVQLAPVNEDHALFANIRWHQTADIGYVPNSIMQNTFMAVAIDLPDDDSPYGMVHPRDKEDVAKRLVLGAFNVSYGLEYNPQGPIILSAARTADGEIVVTYPQDQKLQVQEVGNFEICCDTNKCDPMDPKPSPEWYWAPILSHTQHTITLSSKGCEMIKAKPQILRYAWGQRPCDFKSCSVYNDIGLPAPPFVMEVKDL